MVKPTPPPSLLATTSIYYYWIIRAPPSSHLCRSELLKALCTGSAAGIASIGEASPAYLHLHPLHLDPPVVRGLVQHGLHGAGDALPVREDLVQVLRAQDVPQGGLGQQPATGKQ